jgi:hypothetical protein
MEKNFALRGSHAHQITFDTISDVEKATRFMKLFGITPE